MTRIGASSPLAPPRNVKTACARGLVTQISSCTATNPKPCMVLLIKVFWPSSTLTGGVFSPANLAKAAICGWFTQFGTRISSRIES